MIQEISTENANKIRFYCHIKSKNQTEKYQHYPWRSISITHLSNLSIIMRLVKLNKHTLIKPKV